MLFKVWFPTSKETNTLPIYDITKNEVCDARKFVDDPAEIFFDAEEPKEKISLSVVKDDKEEESEFSDAKEEMGEKDLLGRAIHLDIDKDKGILSEVWPMIIPSTKFQHQNSPRQTKHGLHKSTMKFSLEKRQKRISLMKINTSKD